MTSLAPSRSWILAGCTTTANSNPHGIYNDVSLSTVDLLASIIATRPPFSVVFTLWLSMIVALGVGFLPSASRTQGRSVSLTRSHVPSMVQLRKYLYRVCQGGRSCGTIRQGHPLRSKYRMPFTTSRMTSRLGAPCGGIFGNGDRMVHGNESMRPCGPKFGRPKAATQHLARPS